jgi:hypothetical protein
MATRRGQNVLIVDVELTSDPPNATVFLDGERAGTTPLSASHPAREDEVRIRFERAGYLPLEIKKKPQGNAIRYEARLSPE